MDADLAIRFEGPFSWSGRADAPCIFGADVARRAGVYLWAVPTSFGLLIHYVGETGQSFAARMLQHLGEHFSGGYHLHDPERLVHAEKVCIWPGRYDLHQRTTVTEFINRYRDLWPTIIGLAELYHFFLAPMEVDQRMRRRVEAAIANHLYAQEGLVGQFQDRGIHYQPRRNDEQVLTVSVQCTSALCGLLSGISV